MALHLAALHKQPNIVFRLLHDDGVEDLDEVSSQTANRAGMIPMHLAVLGGCSDCVTLCATDIITKPRLRRHRDKQGMLPGGYAQRHGSLVRTQVCFVPPCSMSWSLYHAACNLHFVLTLDHHLQSRVACENKFHP